MWARWWTRRGKRAATLLLLAGMLDSGRALVVRPDEATLDAAAMVQMEQQADRANPREQCFLYTQLLHALTVVAGREVASGQQREAEQTAQAIGRVTAKAEVAAAHDARKLKDAEQLLAGASRRLSDMTHVLSGDEYQAMHRALQQMNAAHDKILDLVLRQ